MRGLIDLFASGSPARRTLPFRAWRSAPSSCGASPSTRWRTAARSRYPWCRDKTLVDPFIGVDTRIGADATDGNANLIQLVVEPEDGKSLDTEQDASPTGAGYAILLLAYR